MIRASSGLARMIAFFDSAPSDPHQNRARSRTALESHGARALVVSLASLPYGG